MFFPVEQPQSHIDLVGTIRADTPWQFQNRTGKVARADVSGVLLITTA